MKKALIKDTIKEISKTLKRFISILLIVLLGVGFFIGIKSTSPDMRNTIDNFFDKTNVMDLQVLSTLGLTENDLKELKNLNGVSSIIGTYETDVIVSTDKKDFVVRLSTYQNEINKLVLKEGNLPQNSLECLVEENFLTRTGYTIGDKIKIKAEEITNDKGEKNQLLKNNQVKIVGTIESPLYISRERGNSKLGSGKVDYIMYLPKENFNTNIYTNAYIKVDGTKELACYSKKYEDKIKKVRENIEIIQDERKEARYKEIYDEANNKINEAQKKLDEEKTKAEKEIKDAEEKLNNGKNDLQDGKNTLTNQRNKANNEFNKAKKKIDEAQKELNLKEQDFKKRKKEAEIQIKQAQANLTKLKETKNKYDELKTKSTELKKQVELLKQELKKLNPETDNEKITQINMQIETLEKTIKTLENAIIQIENSLQEQGIVASKLGQTITSIENSIKNSKNELTKAEKLINEGKQELKKQTQKYEKTKNDTYAKINKAENDIIEAEREIKENEIKLKDAKNEANEKIKDAEEKLEDARLDLKDIKRPKWYILDREKNIGYMSFIQDTDRINNIARVFPVIFFVVATLICLTTMTRMVEDERVQIGTLKALGYTKMQIAAKYIIYAFLATVIGGIIGASIGYKFIPKIILKMYSMMYTIPEMLITFNFKYAFMGIVTAVLCTVGATIYSCIKSLILTPAKLMRPKAPKPGKRVILERIPFIWNRLNFTKKVTARNIFRYKKRFLMTIIGVLGCTSLIIAGFGLRDAVSTMIPSQYGDVFQYTMQISLKDNLKKKEIERVHTNIKAKEEIKDSIKVNIEAIEISNIDNNQPIQLVVPENVETIDKFIKLRNIKNKKEKYTLNDEGVILTDKLADILNIKKGDTITLKRNDDKEVNVKVEKVTENYMLHYIYMSPKLYQDLYKEEAMPNTIFAITDLSREQEEILGKEILDDKDKIAGVSFISSTTDIFKEVMQNMNVVVLILIVSAGLLALVVLYNLSNTNISERIRELATIKVLGFYNKEVYQYVAKETIILTVIGILLGLLGGTFLTIYIIKTCELDMFMFNPQIKPITFVYGILITVVFAEIVNIATYFALKKIDMIESLKSVE